MLNILICPKQVITLQRRTALINMRCNPAITFLFLLNPVAVMSTNRFLNVNNLIIRSIKCAQPASSQVDQVELVKLCDRDNQKTFARVFILSESNTFNVYKSNKNLYCTFTTTERQHNGFITTNKQNSLYYASFTVWYNKNIAVCGMLKHFKRSSTVTAD